MALVLMCLLGAPARHAGSEHNAKPKYLQSFVRTLICVNYNSNLGCIDLLLHLPVQYL